MAINETAFWAVFMSGVVSAFLGSIFGLMLYPTFNQVIGEYAKYARGGLVFVRQRFCLRSHAIGLSVC